MSIANASETRLAFVTESTWGTTPSNPTFQNLRYTGESFNFDTQTVTSNEIRPDRNVTDLIRVSKSASGGFDFELSYGTFDSILESVMFSTWASNVIKNGNTGKSFSFEKTFETGATDYFLRYTGMYANEFSLNCEAGAIVTGSLGFVGKGGSVASSAISGATYAAATTGDIMNATNDFGSLTIIGISSSPKLMNVSLNVTNNLRQQLAVGNEEAIGVGTGRFEVTGSFRAYFENSDLYNAYLNNTDLGLSWILGSTTGEKYKFDIPKLKIESSTVVAGGNDQDVMVDVNYRGLFDGSVSPNYDATLIITRAVA